MPSLSTAYAPRPDMVALSQAGVMPDGLVQHKLTRLLELRALINAMRCEHEARDPLLSWIRSHGETKNPRFD